MDRDGRIALSVAASPEGIGEAQPVLRRFLEEVAVPERVVMRAELLFEEIVMNVSMHGFADPTGQVVAVTATVAGGAVELVFEDRGREFDPVSAQPKDRPASIEDAEPGGLGLVLLKSMASEVAYERLPGGVNCLRLTVANAPSAGP